MTAEENPNILCFLKHTTHVALLDFYSAASASLVSTHPHIRRHLCNGNALYFYYSYHCPRLIIVSFFNLNFGYCFFHVYTYKYSVSAAG